MQLLLLLLLVAFFIADDQCITLSVDPPTSETAELGDFTGVDPIAHGRSAWALDYKRNAVRVDESEVAVENKGDGDNDIVARAMTASPPARMVASSCIGNAISTTNSALSLNPDVSSECFTDNPSKISSALSLHSLTSCNDFD